MVSEWRGHDVTELFTESAQMTPAEQQTYILSALPIRAAQLGMRVWGLEDGIPIHGRRLLIGVTQYSRGDLDLLDAIHDALLSDQLDVFMISQCKSQAEIEDFVPGIAPVFQSPVVGVWEDGHLTAKGCGWEARQLLARYDVAA
jgi:hypothetical protein